MLRKRVSRRIPWASALVAFLSAHAVSASPAAALDIGYYEMCLGEGRASQATPITNAGHTAVKLTDLTAADLAGVDVAMVYNCENTFYGSEYLSRLADIDAAVASGLVLVLHDRYVDPAESILPGGSSFDIQRHPVFPGPLNEAKDIDVLDASTSITSGPAGTIDNTTLDGGNYSNHGFAIAGTLPGTAKLVLSTNDPAHIVTFVYGYGAGAVLYSSIPLDFYLLGGSNNFATIYAVNVAHYAASLVGGSCGDGVAGPFERCDDGNTTSGDGCSATCEIELLEGDLLVTMGNGATAKVLRIDPITGAQDVLSARGSLDLPRGVATDLFGNVYVADAGAFGVGAIFQIDPATGAQATVSSGGFFGAGVNDVLIEEDGQLLAILASSVNTVVRVDPTTGAQTPLAAGGFFLSARSGALAANGDIYVLDEDADRVVLVNRVSGGQTLVSSGGSFALLGGVALETSGDLVIADRDAFGGNGGVLRVDPGTGAQATVSSGGSFSQPIGIAVEASGSLVVTDLAANLVLRVDPGTGAQSTVSSGGFLTLATDITVVDLPECGDGVAEGPEECDDGNTTGGDCCSSACEFEPAGSACPDGNVCNGDDTCDGAGTCQPGTTLDCDDGDACTQDSCDPVGGCENPAEPATTCADTWAKASLLVKEDIAGKERIQAKLLNGPALGQNDFGDPLVPSGTSYTVCIYDGADALAGRIEVDRAASLCAGRDCWKAVGTTGYLYKDKDASADGAKSLKLLGGAAGKSKVLLKAANNSSKGQTSLPLGVAAALSGSTSATLQVHGSDAPSCFSAALGTVTKDTGSFFKAK